MINLIFIVLFSFLLTACTTSLEEVSAANDSVNDFGASTNTKSNYQLQLDSVFIEVEKEWTFAFSSAEYDEFIKNHPEFFAEYPKEPKLSYRLSFDYKYNECEVGQDEYFVLYAYFLKKRNGEEKWEDERRTLVEIYRHINSIYQRLQYGGTYYSHQYARALGFAEYALYRKPKKEE